MKRIIITILLLVIFIPSVDAEGLSEATLVKCESSSEYILSVNGKNRRVKLNNYYNPNTVIKNEVDSYACNVITNAKKIDVEFIMEKDKYNRELVNINIDNKSMLEILIGEGYGEIGGVTKNNESLNDLCDLEGEAIKKNKGIWAYVTEEEFCKNKMVNKIEEEKKKEDNQNNKKEMDSTTIRLIAIMSMAILLLCIVLAIR